MGLSHKDLANYSSTPLPNCYSIPHLLTVTFLTLFSREKCKASRNASSDMTLMQFYALLSKPHVVRMFCWLFFVVGSCYTRSSFSVECSRKSKNDKTWYDFFIPIINLHEASETWCCCLSMEFTFKLLLNLRLWSQWASFSIFSSSNHELEVL